MRSMVEGPVAGCRPVVALRVASGPSTALRAVPLLIVDGEEL
jgi:hypothetical protein